jgi:1-acyl-sn-glycerol-3-phosphate acyltransferase
MKILLLCFYRLYMWLLFLPFVCLWTLLCGWTAALVAVLVSPRIGSFYVGMAWARVIGWLTPIAVEVSGREHIQPGQTYIVVCNHTSQYDIIVVYGWLQLDLRWVMKQELRKLPGLGLACEKVGHIIVDRSNPESARRSINQALERISDGAGVLFFPEGTRSLDGRLKAFKSGAFRIASDHQLPILPVTVLGTHEILPSKTLKLWPGRARLVIHPPVLPADKSLRELMHECREAMASALPADKRGG